MPLHASLNPRAHLFHKIDDCDLHSGFLPWTGNDENKRECHNPVALSDSPKDLRLFWKASKGSEPKFIGCYRLFLHELLDARYVWGRLHLHPG